jgi:hypothetical protein
MNCPHVVAAHPWLSIYLAAGVVVSAFMVRHFRRIVDEPVRGIGRLVAVYGVCVVLWGLYVVCAAIALALPGSETE